MFIAGVILLLIGYTAHVAIDYNRVPYAYEEEVIVVGVGISLVGIALIFMSLVSYGLG